MKQIRGQQFGKSDSFSYMHLFKEEKHLETVSNLDNSKFQLGNL